jgi:small conductance mechanosensitive channel
MGDQTIELITNVGIFIGILTVTVLTAYLVNRFFKRLIHQSTEFMQNDPTNYLFFRHAITAMIYIVGISIAIFVMPNLRALASSLLAGAGILAVAVGFASQQALSNIISGLFIVIFRPFRINDRVSLRDMVGIIEDITLRHTVIRDFENRRIIIPNAVMSDEIIINSSIADERICNRLDIGISYDANIELAKSIIKDEILNHHLSIDARTELQIEQGEELAPVRVLGLAESSVNLRGWAWAQTAAEGFLMECDLYESIKLRFDKEGIEIPYPHRTIVTKSYKNS